MKWTTYNTLNNTTKYLYKFLSQENLKLFLASGSIWFSRADIFGDKMECVRIKDLLKEKPDYEAIKARKRKFLISCWHLADKESLVLWDTYSESVDKRRTTAIRFKREDLIFLMKEYAIKNHGNLFYRTTFTHGRVKYKELIGKDSKWLKDMVVNEPSFRKEEAFRYENEYRFVIKLVNEHSKEGYSYVTKESKNMPFKVIINPLLENDAYFKLKDKIETLGFADKLIQSDLAGWLHPELW